LKSFTCSLNARKAGLGVAELDDEVPLTLTADRDAVGVAIGAEAGSGDARGALASATGPGADTFSGELAGVGATTVVVVQANSSAQARLAARPGKKAQCREANNDESARIRSDCNNKLPTQRMRHHCGNGHVDEIAYQARSLP